MTRKEVIAYLNDKGFVQFPRKRNYDTEIFFRPNDEKFQVAIKIREAFLHYFIPTFAPFHRLIRFMIPLCGLSKQRMEFIMCCYDAHISFLNGTDKD